MITVGLDIGSLTTKSAILNQENEILGYDIVLTGGDNRQATETTLYSALEKAGLQRKDIAKIVTTGYGRQNIPFADKHASEITCHAKGMHLLNPAIRTILDIGGQDSTAFQIDPGGNVLSFQMNDKCAAGCGRFLEIIAKALDVRLEDLGSISQEARATARISSMCTVFAETEVVSLVAVGTPIADIISGVHQSIAVRAVSLLKMVGIHAPIGMSGGVAQNIGVVHAIERMLKVGIEIPSCPQIVGAIGAAHIAQCLVKAEAT
jgi:(R)-2-hydroxyacyl-CoA dehydratese activating ATPase